jgi:hypothetical protein
MPDTSWTPKLIIGRAEVARYLQCSVNTVDRYVRKHGLPLCPLPSGRLATSYFLLDAWLQSRGKQYQELRGKQYKELSNDEDPECQEGDTTD